jgi:hypothetical protein
VTAPDDELERRLAAWREDSLRPADAAARERARAALMRAVAAGDRSGQPAATRLGLALRSRHRAWRVAGAFGVAVAAAAVATSGWNAPAGSPLHGVRSARQGVQLALPGANLAALHLDFAAQSLADARHGIAPAASLAEAAAELDAAHRDLPGDRSSPLWGLWNHDEEQLASERAAYRGGSPSPRGSEEGTAPAQPGSSPHPTESADGGGSGQPSERPQVSSAPWEGPQPPASASPGHPGG